MKEFRILILLLCTSSVTAQKVLPAESLQGLDSLITALDYVIEPEFEHNYILRYDVEGGHVVMLREKFYVGTTNKTPDQYYNWFKLSDVDPETMEILEDEEGIGLQFFTANNTRTIINSIYVEDELRMQSESDRLLLGYWHTDADRDLLINIKDELTRLIHQVWDGNKPPFETDVQKPAALFINGKEVIWEQTPATEGEELSLFESSVEAQSKSMVRGVYKSFEDFKAERTAVVDSFYLDSVARTKDNWLGTYAVTPRYVKNNKVVRRIWGFYDGTRSWIYFQNEFFPLEFNGYEFRFEAYGIADDGGAVVSGMLFGLVGAAVYSAVANDAAKDQRVLYVIDPNNGNIYDADALDFDLLTLDEQYNERTLVLYRATKKEMDEPMRFSVNDSLVDWFIPGSYYEMTFPTDIKRVSICSGNGFEDCETILFTGATQYVECTFTKNSELNEYQFISVNQSEGEHSSVWSFDVQERREKRQRKMESKEK